MNYFNKYFFQGVAEALAVSMPFPIAFLIGTLFLPVAVAFVLAIPFAMLSLFWGLSR